MGRTKARERDDWEILCLPPFSLPITPCSRRARYAKTAGDESASLLFVVVRSVSKVVSGLQM